MLYQIHAITSAPKNRGSVAGSLALILAIMFALTPGFSDAQSVNANARAFGKGQPAFIDDLPPGIFRKQLKALPAPTRAKALKWLQNETFPAADVAYLRVDSRGRVFFEDPAVDHADTGDGGGTVSVGEISLSNIFKLHSKPGASRTVHVDMDGHVVSGTAWNQGNADPLYMRPYDKDGDGIKATGSMNVQLWDLNKPEEESLLSEWDVPPDELKKMWFKTVLAVNYRLTFDVSDKVESFDEALTAKVAFTDYLTGRVFKAQRVIEPR